jgi:hypothetical protein
MGYSCTAAANYTLDAIGELIGSPSSNGMPNGDGFFEIGRENADGAITGTVWRKLNAAERARFAHLDALDDRVQRRGSFRIDESGKVRRFPGLPATLLRQAEAKGAMTYARHHGLDNLHDAPDWRKLRGAILASLDGGAKPFDLWDVLQAVASAYQRENKVTFLTLPGINADDYRSFLANLGE